VVDTRDGNALVVMARYPRAGAVKTRLAAAIGAEHAAELYRAFLADLSRRLGADPRWTLHWTFEPADSPFATEIAAGSDAFPQADGDLGRRMARAIEAVLAAGATAAVLIGSDVPHLAAATVACAFDRLAAGADLVLVPTDDGGYCLVGARAVPPVFAGPRWGASSVLAETVRLARAAGLEPSLLDATFDVDDADGLERLRARIASGDCDLPATREVLERVRPVRYK
jgi:rSAM/selenodomain-associated transferase 1